MRWVTKNDISDLTGSSWRTVKKRLDEAGLKPNDQDAYPSDVALGAFYGADKGEDDGPQLTAEKARLAAAQAEKYELENAVKRGELLPRTEVQPAWSSFVVATRSRLMAIAPGIAPLLSITMEPGGCQDIVESAVYEALSDLANSEVSAGIVAPAAEAEPIGVGGQAPEAKPRGKRRTGPVEDEQG